jgi:hypothetical protein
LINNQCIICWRVAVGYELFMANRKDEETRKKKKAEVEKQAADIRLSISAEGW